MVDAVHIADEGVHLLERLAVHRDHLQRFRLSRHVYPGIELPLARRERLLAAPLRAGTLTPADLLRVERRRVFPTRVTQLFQVLIQNRVISRVLASRKQFKVPWLLRMLRRFPILRRIPARLVGVGFRPEHVRTPDAFHRNGSPVS